MKHLMKLLLAIWVMATAAPVLGAQEAVVFKSQDRAAKYNVSTEILVNNVKNSVQYAEGEIAEAMTEIFEQVSPSSGENEPAVLILKSKNSSEWFFIQYKEDGHRLHSLWILSEEFGWMKATRRARRQLQELIPNFD